MFTLKMKGRKVFFSCLYANEKEIDYIIFVRLNIVADTSPIYFPYWIEQKYGTRAHTANNTKKLYSFNAGEQEKRLYGGYHKIAENNRCLLCGFFFFFFVAFLFFAFIFCEVFWQTTFSCGENELRNKTTMAKILATKS